MLLTLLFLLSSFLLSSCVARFRRCCPCSCRRSALSVGIELGEVLGGLEGVLLGLADGPLKGPIDGVPLGVTLGALDGPVLEQNRRCC